MEIVETPFITPQITELLSDDEYRKLQCTLISNPFMGDLIQGGHGLRKLRWAITGKGKRGGLRIIYYFLLRDEVIYLIYAYKKSRQNELTNKQLKLLSDYVKRGVL